VWPAAAHLRVDVVARDDDVRDGPFEVRGKQVCVDAHRVARRVELRGKEGSGSEGVFSVACDGSAALARQHDASHAVAGRCSCYLHGEDGEDEDDLYGREDDLEEEALEVAGRRDPPLA